MVIFNGKDLNGKTMDIAAQAKLFRSASVVIGPHGSGLANIVWTMATKTKGCKGRVAVLEFLCGPRSLHVQNGCSTYTKTYFNLFASAPWVNYHHVLYASNSTEIETFINLLSFQVALDSIFR